MKVYLEKKGRGKWEVVINHGVQYFRLGSVGPKEHALFLAKMFRHALKAHDKSKQK